MIRVDKCYEVLTKYTNPGSQNLLFLIELIQLMLSPFYWFYQVAILRAINGGLIGYVSLICMLLLIITGFMKLFYISFTLFFAILFLTIYLGHRDGSKS